MKVLIASLIILTTQLSHSSPVIQGSDSDESKKIHCFDNHQQFQIYSQINREKLNTLGISNSEKYSYFLSLFFANTAQECKDNITKVQQFISTLNSSN